MSDFKTILDAAIEQLGGSEAVQKLLSVGASALSNYRMRAQIPAAKRAKLEEALAQQGWHLDLQGLQLTPLNLAQQQRVLLLITGGIAAYKALDLARRLMDKGYQVRGVMTRSAMEFITPLSLSALTGEKTYSELFSLTDEAEMGHIRLARDADIVLVAPATANFLAKMAHGLADDLASTLCLATDCPVMIAPAMNPNMWAHPAVRANIEMLKDRGVTLIAPEDGDTACGEVGTGRLAESAVIISALEARLAPPLPGPLQPLAGRHILVTSGPTFEPIDPVRYIANHSSGKQGHAIAKACADKGARVTLISGPVQLEDPAGVEVIKVTTAGEMYDACMASLPADCAICAAAVADWHVVNSGPQKIKKTDEGIRHLQLAENPDILASLSQHENRPHLVIGFAAETENIARHAAAKRARKKCDWIVANWVGGTGKAAVFGQDSNHVTMLDDTGAHDWPRASKTEIAITLTQKIEAWFDDHQS
ncbi:MAG: bifunctional phosphopantothenoylcysteine decarboxylase/phosphopantothenate--cysteine ligase CoaBC [Candidatus Puniceispirillaceae bacterium]